MPKRMSTGSRMRNNGVVGDAANSGDAHAAPVLRCAFRCSSIVGLSAGSRCAAQRSVHLRRAHLAQKRAEPVRVNVRAEFELPALACAT